MEYDLGAGANTEISTIPKEHKGHIDRKISRKDAKAQRETDEPRINQPSREAMAGKLQIYADGVQEA